MTVDVDMSNRWKKVKMRERGIRRYIIEVITNALMHLDGTAGECCIPLYRIGVV
jgi:hypothetical protein